jgi:hypothetical protein
MGKKLDLRVIGAQVVHVVVYRVVSLPLKVERILSLLEELYHDEGFALLSRPEIRWDGLPLVEGERCIFEGLSLGR